MHFQSEKLLGDLGGLFSKKWKPKKNSTIRGPMLSRGNFYCHLKLDCKMTTSKGKLLLRDIGYGAFCD
jgi:hypothetical protein